jgi:heme/copper-type cytochrome/quinol oxidase subunit 3
VAAQRAVLASEVAPGNTLRDALVRSRMWIAAEAFFFVSFVFSYVYLRVLNVNGKWRPPHTSPPTVIGTVAFAMIVVSAVICAVALRRMRSGAVAAWRGASLLALILGTAAVALFGWELTHLNFSAADTGFGSVFVGWTALYALNVLGAMYWLETLVAQGYRYPPPPALGTAELALGGDGEGDGEREGDGGGKPRAVPIRFVSSLAVGAEQFTGFWYFMAGVGVLTWILLYLA